MAAKGKSSKSKSSRPKASGDSSGLWQLLFQVIVVAAIGWFVYSGYIAKKQDARKPLPKTIAHQVEKKKTSGVSSGATVKEPIKKTVVSPKPVPSKLPAHKTSPEKTEIVQRQQPVVSKPVVKPAIQKSAAPKEYPEIAMAAAPRPKSSKKVRKPKIVFVIDDIGHTNEFQSLVFALGNKITYAILPDLEYSRFFDQISRKTGADVILHLPLETQSGRYPGPGLIENDMSDAEILRMLDHNFASTPSFIGANNHMGSSGSTNRRVMKVILNEFKRRNKFFLDSYTTKDSVIVEVASRLKVPVQRRDVFLDNTDDQKYIRNQIRQLADVAYKKGYAIGIGHYRYNTLKVISEEIPRLEDSGYQIVPLSDLYD